MKKIINEPARVVSELLKGMEMCIRDRPKSLPG